MHVVINQLSAIGRRTGVGQYTAQLIQCLLRQAGPGEICPFPQGWMRLLREIHAQVPSLIRRSGVGQHFLLSYLRRGTWALLTRQFRKVCRKASASLYHEPNFIPFPSDSLTVATIHDLSILRDPEWHPADRLSYFEKHFPRGMAQCAHFIAISDFGRRELISKLGIHPARISRTYLGIRPDLAPLPRRQVELMLRRLGLPSRYLLYVGTIEPRKNVLMLLRAYCSLPAHLRAGWPLVMAGGWGWNSDNVADFYHREARHRGVIYRGYVADKYLGALYNGARGLLFPSHYEGFGLPPLEMMACGGAVLASTATALTETLGAQAHLIHAADEAGWRNSMARVLTDDDWCHALRQGATAVAHRYTWDRCAAETLRVYQKVWGQESHNYCEQALQKTTRAA